MANPYKDEKTGKFISKADFKSQEKLNKSLFENLQAQEESLKIQKEIAAANKAGNTELAKQLELEKNKNIELAKQLKAKKALNDSKSGSKSSSKDEETAYKPAKDVEVVDSEGKVVKTLIKDYKTLGDLQKSQNDARFEGLSYDEQSIDLAKMAHQELTSTKGVRKEAISLSEQIIQDMKDEADLMAEAGLAGDTLLRSEDELQNKIADSKRIGKDLSFEIMNSEGDVRDALMEQEEQQQRIGYNLTHELAQREDVNKELGVMDNLMLALEDIPFLKQFYDGEDAVHEMEQSLMDGGTAAAGLANYMKSMKSDAWDIAKSWIKFDSTKDIGKFLWNTMMAVNVETTKLSKDMGLSSLAASGMRIKMAGVAMESGKMAITTQDTLAAMNSLNDQWGVASSVIRGDVVGEITSLTKLTDMSAESAGRFATTMMASGQAASTVTEAARQTVRATADEFGVRLNVNKALDEAGKVTGEMSANMGFNVVKITQTLAVAKQLGMTMADLAGSSKSMLDFQSSIEAELQAELFTGKQLNLEKARLAALTGDYETLGREINKNLATEHEWTNMNVLAKEKMAAALGMSSDQMSDIIYKGKNLAALAAQAEERGDYAAQQDLEKRDMQQKMNDLITKASSIAVDYLAPALDVVANVMKTLADNSGLMYTIMGAMAVLKLGGLIAGVVTLAGTLAASGIAGAALMSSLTLGIGAIAIAGGIAAIAMAARSATSQAKSDATTEDGFITPEEGLVVSSKKGTIQLHPKDSVAVGTDLLGNSEQTTTNDVSSVIDQTISKNFQSFIQAELIPNINTEQGSIQSPVINQNVTKNISVIPETPQNNLSNRYNEMKDKEQQVSIKPIDLSDPIIKSITENYNTILPQREIEDGVIDSDGSLVVSGERGSIQLDPEDQVAVGTDLGGSSVNGNTASANSQDSARMQRYQAESIALLKKISIATAASGVGSMIASVVYSGFDAVKADTHYGTKFN